MQLQALDVKWPEETPGVPSRHGVNTEKWFFVVLTVKQSPTELLQCFHRCCSTGYPWSKSDRNSTPWIYQSKRTCGTSLRSLPINTGTTLNMTQRKNSLLLSDAFTDSLDPPLPQPPPVWMTSVSRHLAFTSALRTASWPVTWCMLLPPCWRAPRKMRATVTTSSRPWTPSPGMPPGNFGRVAHWSKSWCCPVPDLCWSLFLVGVTLNNCTQALSWLRRNWWLFSRL